METSYIQMLAQNTSTDISKWDLPKVFGDVTDRREINKRFFEQTKQAVPVKTKKLTVPKASRIALDNTKIIAKLEASMKKERVKSQKLAAKMELIQQNIVAINTKITGAKGGSAGWFIEAQVKEIIAAGFWENPIFKGQYLYLNTKNDVIMHQTDRTAVPPTLNFGKFGVCVDLKTFSLYLQVYENNLGYDTNYTGEHIHPYCFSANANHGMCFGDAYNTYAKMKADLNLPGVLKLFAALLTTYENCSTPVVAFGSFHQDHKLDVKRYFNRLGTGVRERCIHPTVLKKYQGKAK